MALKTPLPATRCVVSWRVRREVRDAIKVAAAQDKTTCERFIDELAARELSRRGLYPTGQVGFCSNL